MEKIIRRNGNQMKRILLSVLTTSVIVGCSTTGANPKPYIPENVQSVTVDFTPGKFVPPNQPKRSDIEATVTDPAVIRPLVNLINRMQNRTGVGGCTADNGQELILTFKTPAKTYAYKENLACYTATVGNSRPLNDPRMGGIVSFVRQNIVTDVSIIDQAVPADAKPFSSIQQAKSKYPTLIAPNTLSYGLKAELVFLQTKSNEFLTSPTPKKLMKYQEWDIIYSSQDNKMKVLLTETPDNIEGISVGALGQYGEPISVFFNGIKGAFAENDNFCVLSWNRNGQNLRLFVDRIQKSFATPDSLEKIAATVQ